MSTLKWVILAMYLIPIRHEHLWMYSIDTLVIFGVGYYWKEWRKSR